jgi:hypothetical protein
MPQAKKSDSYIIDTYGSDGKHVPGAIVFSGRKRIETMQWKEHAFDTREEADAFVRKHFASTDLIEKLNEEELRSA